MKKKGPEKRNKRVSHIRVGHCFLISGGSLKGAVCLSDYPAVGHCWRPRR